MSGYVDLFVNLGSYFVRRPQNCELNYPGNTFTIYPLRSRKSP